MFFFCVKTQIYAWTCTEILFNSLKPAVVNKPPTYSNYSTAKTLASPVNTPDCCLNSFSIFSGLSLTLSRGHLGFSLPSKTCCLRKLKRTHLGASALVFLFFQRSYWSLRPCWWNTQIQFCKHIVKKPWCSSGRWHLNARCQWETEETVFFLSELSITVSRRDKAVDSSFLLEQIRPHVILGHTLLLLGLSALKA